MSPEDIQKFYSICKNIEKAGNSKISCYFALIDALQFVNYSVDYLDEEIAMNLKNSFELILLRIHVEIYFL